MDNQCNDVVQWKEQLKKVSFNDYGYEIQKRAAQQNEAADRSVLSTNDKANSYVKEYAELYDEMQQMKTEPINSKNCKNQQKKNKGGRFP